LRSFALRVLAFANAFEESLRGTAQLQAFVARAFEISVFRNHYMAALLADGPGRPLQHRPEIIAQNAVGAANDVFSHFDPFRCFAQRAWAALPDPAGHAAPPDALPLDSRRTGVFNGNLHDGLLKAVQTNPNSHGPTVQAKYLCLRSLNHWRRA